MTRPLTDRRYDVLTDVERAYAFAPGVFAMRPGSVTSPKHVEDAVWAIVAAWNKAIPIRKIRKLTQTRFRECAHTLRVWRWREIIAGIEFYSRQKWQRQNRAWKPFENWIVLDVCTEWIEQALNVEDRKPMAAGKAKDLVDQSAGVIAADEVARLLREFEQFSPGEQTDLFAQAARELRSLPRGDKLRLAPTLACGPVRSQIVTILRRRKQRRATTEHTEHAERKR